LNARASRWTMLTIHNILTNETYIGHSVYGRDSVKLGQKRVINPPDTWIRHHNAFKGIIAPKLFAEAQKIISERRYRRSDQEMLDLLSALWRKKGHLSVNIITSAKGVPPVSNYASRFGSLFNAYQRIGYQLDPRYNYTGSRAKVEIIINTVVDDLITNVGRLGGSATYLSELHLLTINQKLTVSIGVATCVSDGNVRLRRWQLRRFKYSKADFSLVLKMDESNTNPSLLFATDRPSEPKDELQTPHGVPRFRGSLSSGNTLSRGRTTRHEPLNVCSRCSRETMSFTRSIG